VREQRRGGRGGLPVRCGDLAGAEVLAEQRERGVDLGLGDVAAVQGAGGEVRRRGDRRQAGAAAERDRDVADDGADDAWCWR
jgi:hypothetical protein